MTRRGGGGPEDRAAPITPDSVREMLSTLIEECRVEFIVIGGFAVAAHGRIRGTRDLDLCPDPDPANLQRLTSALEAIDATVLDLDEFEDEHDLKPDLEGLGGGGNWRLKTRHGGLDIMQDLSGLAGGYADLAAGAEERVFLGYRVRFCGYEDLITMKEAAGRPQDLIDIEDLRAARGET